MKCAVIARNDLTEGLVQQSIVKEILPGRFERIFCIFSLSVT
jgi:hypothetical protein